MLELSPKQQIAVRLTILVAVAGLIGAGLYFLFFKSSPAVNPQPSTGTGGTTSTSGLPTAGTGTGGTVVPGGTGTSGTGALPSSPVANGGKTTTFTLTNSAVTSPVATADGTVAYYDPADGHFYTISTDGNAELLTSAAFSGADAVTFSSDTSEAVVEFPDGSNIIYNFDTQKQTSMPSHWEDFSFSANGSEVAAKSIAADPSARALIVTAADGSSTKVVAALGSNDNLVDVNWSPDGSVLGFSRTGNGGTAFGQQEIYLLDQNGEAAGILLVDGTNFKATWSPDNTHLIYSVADAGVDYKATLWYADKDGDRKGETRKSIPLLTLATKCTFASATAAYCAVPETMPAGGGSSPNLITTPDSLYKVDLPSMRVTLLAIPSVNTQMFELSVNSTGDTLYYTDAYGRLSYMKLK